MNRKTSYILTLSFLSLLLLFPQLFEAQDQLSALRKRLKEADNDTLRIAYLNKIAQANINMSQTDSAISYAQQALGIAQSINSERWEVESLISIANAYKLNKQFSEALDYYLKASNLAESLGNDKLLAAAYMDLGLLYQDWNVHEQALEYYKQVYDIKGKQGDIEGQMQLLNYIGLAKYQTSDYKGALESFIELAEKASETGDVNTEISALRNIAQIYSTRNEHEDALRYSLDILNIKQELQDSLGIATYLNNVGFIYQKLQQRGKAKKYFKDALEMNRQIGREPRENITMLLNIGVIYQHDRDYDNALDYYKEALGILEQTKESGQIAKTCNYITTIYLGIQDYDNAKLYTEKAIELAQDAGDLKVLANSYMRLSEIYQKQRSNRKALEYYKKYAAIKDSMIIEEQNKQKLLAAKKIEAEKEEKELKLKLAAQERKALELEAERMQEASRAKQLELQAARQNLQLKEQDLELAKLKEVELKKEQRLQSLQLQQQRLESEQQQQEMAMQQQEMAILEKDKKLERQQRLLSEKESEEHRKQIEKLELSQRVKDLQLDNLRRTRLFVGISLGLLVVLIAVVGIGYFQKNKANKKLAAINTEINQKREEIEAQRDQISQQKAEIERSYQDIQLLSIIGQKITASLDIESVSITVYEYITSLMAATTVGLGIYNKANETIEFRGSVENGNILPFHYHELDATNSLAVWSFNNRKQLVINNLEDDYKKYISHPPETKTETKMRSAVYLPLLTENRPIGAITVQSDQISSYSSKDISILQTLASYISIALDNASAYDVIKTKNKHITDSLRYAQTIQKAILPSERKMSSALKEHFVLYYPKDIVSGDFFWFLHLPKEKIAGSDRDKTYIAAIDCTGHGVPGAFMSMIGNTLLNDIVTQKQAYEPAEILELLHTSIVTELRQAEGANDDGMDACLCLLEKEDDGQTRVTYTGAKRPLYYVEAGSERLREIKGTNKNIGGVLKKHRAFENQTITLPSDSLLYLSTDGLPDQHDKNKKKIGSTRFKYTLQENHQKSFSEQKEALASLLFKHQSGTPQRDDITVVGIRL